jgi:RimJ/RimL family protein N-acetyltransferase
LKPLQTARLNLRPLTLDDAAFILELVNEPSWLRYIGDRGVRTLDDARVYLTKGPLDMYARLGFGLLLVELREDGTPLGLCGLIKRDTLPDVDIGFAFLPEYWGKGYAREAAAAALADAAASYGLQRVVAITTLDNEASIRLLEKIGFRFDRLIGGPDGTQLRLFTLELG